MKSIERRIQKLATSLKIEVNPDYFIYYEINEENEKVLELCDSDYIDFPNMKGDFSFLEQFEDIDVVSINVAQEINLNSLQNCHFLKRINIEYAIVNIDGSFYLPNLKSLRFEISSYIKTSSLSFLTQFPNLETFQYNFNLNNIQNINALEKLSKLKILSLNSGIFSSLDIISKLSTLEQLYLYNCKNIIDFTALKNFKKLIHLTIHTCKFKDTSVLSHFKNLQTLSLAFNKIQDIEELRSLSDLTTINLSHNAVKSIDAITELPNLVNINVSSNEITEIPQFKSSQITHAYFSNNSITSIENLATIDSLQYLNVTDNRIQKITQLPKNLVQLHANNNPIEELQTSNYYKLLSIHCENHFIKEPEKFSINSDILQYINLKHKNPSLFFSGEYYEKGAPEKKIFHLYKLHGDHFFKKRLFDQAYKTYEKFVLLKNIIACRKIEQHLLDETPQTFDTLFNHIDTFMQTKKESNRIYDLVGNKKVLEYTSEMIALRIKNANISKKEKQELYYKLLYKVYPNTDNETPENTLIYNTQAPTLKSKDHRFIARVELFFWVVGIVSFLIMIITFLKILLFR